MKVVMSDNISTDDSVVIANKFGVEVIVRRCSQAQALNELLRLSNAAYTLLLHADVVLLDPRWFDLCVSKCSDNTILVSPEDIGCGPYSRPFGAGKPESSFLFTLTDALRKTRVLQTHSFYRFPIPKRVVDFYGSHVTHRLPQRLNERGFNWFSMLVHTSDIVSEPIYKPAFEQCVWSEELGYLRYGLGNFYSIDSVITHYHNWYDRIDLNVDAQSQQTTSDNGAGFPVAYIKTYTQAFLRDYADGSLKIPQAVISSREPRAI